MDPTPGNPLSPDELAGVADLFGGLTRTELRRAVENVAARRGTPFDPSTVDDAVASARREYYLLAVEHGDETVLTPGPAALPALPEHGADLPHMMDVEERDIDADDLAEASRERLETDADAAIEAGDRDRARALLDICYDAEAWRSVDVEHVRERLVGTFEEL